eukprot:9488549-Pyramimonas_sp.AAC.1
MPSHPSLCEACNELENKGKEYGTAITVAGEVEDCTKTAKAALELLFKGRVAKAWHGVNPNETTKIRASLVAVQKTMTAHNVVPAGVLGAILTDVFRKGLRSVVVT